MGVAIDTVVTCDVCSATIPGISGPLLNIAARFVGIDSVALPFNPTEAIACSYKCAAAITQGLADALDNPAPIPAPNPVFP